MRPVGNNGIPLQWPYVVIKRLPDGNCEVLTSAIRASERVTSANWTPHRKMAIRSKTPQAAFDLASVCGVVGSEIAWLDRNWRIHKQAIGTR